MQQAIVYIKPHPEAHSQAGLIEIVTSKRKTEYFPKPSEDKYASDAK